MDIGYLRKLIVSTVICIILSFDVTSVTFAQSSQLQNTTVQKTVQQATEEYNKKYENALTKAIEIGYLFSIISELQQVKDVEVKVAYRWFL